MHFKHIIVVLQQIILVYPVTTIGLQGTEI